MNGDELKRAAIELLGRTNSSFGWQSDFAYWLKVSPRTVRRWHAMDYTPDRIRRLIEAELKLKERNP
jgi:hypothetical protein